MDGRDVDEMLGNIVGGMLSHCDVEIGKIQAEAMTRGLPALQGATNLSQLAALAAHQRRKKAWDALDVWKHQARAHRRVPETSWELLNQFEANLAEWSLERWAYLPDASVRPFSGPAQFWTMTTETEKDPNPILVYLVGCDTGLTHCSAGILQEGRAWETLTHECECGAVTQSVLLPDEVEFMLRRCEFRGGRWKR